MGGDGREKRCQFMFRKTVFTRAISYLSDLFRSTVNKEQRKM